MVTFYDYLFHVLDSGRTLWSLESWCHHREARRIDETVASFCALACVRVVPSD
jgi:hypothetical protein